MEFNIRFKNRYAITIQEKTMNKLILLLNEYYPNTDISISATSNNDDTVRFNDVKELLTYDNSGDYRIKTLNIKSGSNHYCEIKFNSGVSLFFQYDSTISISFGLERKDECIAFRAKLENIFREMRQPLYYTILSKISIEALFLWIGILWLFYHYLQPENTRNISISIPIFAFTILVVVFGISFILGINRILVTLFPPIHFSWGDEVIRLEKMAKTRSNIFWVVIIGIILAIISRHI
jgi:hypothetical protein